LKSGWKSAEEWCRRIQFRGKGCDQYVNNPERHERRMVKKDCNLDTKYGCLDHIMI